jgi:Tetratrico peptide repeat
VIDEDRLAADSAGIDSYEPEQLRALIDGMALEALEPHLPRYQRSLGAYARDLR